ncbi:hypothetical protein PLICRDRAFT_521255 [Plicaturopsis crispa FD-325 SS-3]|nr:hypothetical protein PLICRDRAFT_521255 [Plicaturopsis crispa FD-325 SS-3]
MGTRTGGKSGSNVSSIGTRTSLVSNSGVGSTGVKRSGSTVGSMGDKGSLRTGTSSRLLAPTASSLAKAQGSVRLSAAHSQEHIHGRSPGLASVAEQRSRPTNAEASSSKPALDQITNSPRPAGTPLHSPRPGPIFSKPLTAPGSSIPTPVRNQTFGAAASTLADTKPLVLAPKPKALAGRKPRISRSKVIARLASQRAAPSAEAAAGRTRSSMGAAVRQSAGRKSGGGRRSGGAEVLMSAKKRARQSEYARRRSRAGAGSAIGLGGGAMNIDS